MCFPFGHVTCVFPMNQSCGRNIHWMMNIAFSFKSKLRLKGFTSQSKIVASSVIMMVTVITKSESHSCFVFTLNNILPACLRELNLFDYSKYKAFSSPSMLDMVVGNNFSLELFHSKNSISLLCLNTLALLIVWAQLSIGILSASLFSNCAPYVFEHIESPSISWVIYGLDFIRIILLYH